MKPISNIMFWIQYLAISFILGLQENIYETIKKTYYISAGFAGRHVVKFWYLNIDIFLEVQDKKSS